MGNRPRGKVAVVTGASRGIGRAISLLFAKEGAQVCVNYSVDEKAARRVAEEIERVGSHALVVRADVSDPELVRKMIALSVWTARASRHTRE